MRLISHMLIAISLSSLHLGLANTRAFALPINEPEPKSDSRIYSPPDLSRLRPIPLRLVGRQIHNADYGSGEQPQNTTYSSTSNTPDASSPTPDSKSPSGTGKSPKTDLARQKQSMRQVNPKGEVANDVPMTKLGHKWLYSDGSSELSNDATPHYEGLGNSKDQETSAKSAPGRLVRRTHSTKSLDYTPEDFDCDYYVHYPSMRMRYARDLKYGVASRPRREIYLGTFYYQESLLNDWRDYRFPRRLRSTSGLLGAGQPEGAGDENGDDVNSGRGTPGARHFDPKDVDRMLAAYDLSHGILVG